MITVSDNSERLKSWIDNDLMNLTSKLNGNTVSSIFINLKQMISHDISIRLDQLQDDISMLHIYIDKVK